MMLNGYTNSMSDNRSTSDSNQHYCKIVLADNNCLFAHLLKGHIEQHLQLDCHLNTNLPQDVTSDTLVLINCASYSFETVLDWIYRIQEVNPDASIAVCNIDDDIDVDRLVKHPVVKGIFHREHSLHLLARGVDEICNGKHWFSREQMEILARQRVLYKKNSALNYLLTGREREILILLAKGMNNTAISDALYVSYNTIKTHLYHLYKKLGVKNRAQAIRWAYKHLDVED